MATHELKCWPNAFEAIRDGRKRFEWRRDDRGFEVGDVLVLKLYDPHAHGYSSTGPAADDGSAFGDYVKNEASERIEQRVRVTYILRSDWFGVPQNFCIMSIELTTEPDNGE